MYKEDVENVDECPDVKYINELSGEKNKDSEKQKRQRHNRNVNV